MVDGPVRDARMTCAVPTTEELTITEWSVRTGVVQELITRVVGQGQFSVGYLQRTQNKEFGRQAYREEGLHMSMKPNGLHISEMFDTEFMVHRAIELLPGTHG